MYVVIIGYMRMFFFLNPAINFPQKIYCEQNLCN